MKLATWNVNSLNVRLPHLLDWLGQQQPDVLVLQETKLTDDKFPAEALREAGWHARWFGQRTYNGVALLSRSADIDDVTLNLPGFEDAQARVIAATVGGVRVIGAYFPNGQAPDSDKFVYKMAWLDALQRSVAEALSRWPRLVLMGDFNIAPEDRDVHDPAAWAGQIHCTPQERAHFAALLDHGLHDAYRLFEQPDRTFSWWDYRNLAFRRNQGLRIDHILVSEALRPQVRACGIDKAPRRLERPSDHAPVWVELEPLL